MHPLLRAFVDAHCHRCPSAAYPVKAFCEAFYDSLPPKARESWRRSRVVAALVEAGYPIALDPASRVYAIAGIAPRAGLQTGHDGRLELVAHV
jgi:hypothetical protein